MSQPVATVWADWALATGLETKQEVQGSEFNARTATLAIQWNLPIVEPPYSGGLWAMSLRL